MCLIHSCRHAHVGDRLACNAFHWNRLVQDMHAASGKRPSAIHVGPRLTPIRPKILDFQTNYTPTIPDAAHIPLKTSGKRFRDQASSSTPLNIRNVQLLSQPRRTCKVSCKGRQPFADRLYHSRGFIIVS